MVENISKVLDRSERIELMVDKTDHLSRTSKRFTNESRELRQAMWWHNMKVFLGVSLCVMMILSVLISMAYFILKND
jgi:vesicle-associated membrane protein 7